MAYYSTRYRTTSYLSGSLPPGVKWLIIVNVAVFLLCYFGGYPLQRHVTLLLALSPETAIRNLFVWQVFTYMFVHYGIMHVLFNMLGLWFFGVPIEQTWGTRRFLKFYFLCGVAAGVCVLIANVLVGEWAVPTIGASGAIFGILVAFGILFPETIILMFFLFPMKAKYAVMIYVAVELLATFGPNTGVSTIAHLGGALFAYLYLRPSFRRLRLPSVPDLRTRYHQWKMQRARKQFQVYMRKKDGRGPWVN
jgi:membrane associated rhomboid family serine protease